jgi:hypothetical protein
VDSVPFERFARRAADRTAAALALFNQMRKRDWAFVAACVAGAMVLGVWSVRMGIAFHRAHGVTDLSSSQRRTEPAPAADAPAVLQKDDLDQPSARPQ